MITTLKYLPQVLRTVLEKGGIELEDRSIVFEVNRGEIKIKLITSKQLDGFFVLTAQCSHGMTIRGIGIEKSKKGGFSKGKLLNVLKGGGEFSLETKNINSKTTISVGGRSYTFPTVMGTLSEKSPPGLLKSMDWIYDVYKVLSSYTGYSDSIDVTDGKVYTTGHGKGVVLDVDYKGPDLTIPLNPVRVFDHLNIPLKGSYKDGNFYAEGKYEDVRITYSSEVQPVGYLLKMWPKEFSGSVTVNASEFNKKLKKFITKVKSADKISSVTLENGATQFSFGKDGYLYIQETMSDGVEPVLERLPYMDEVGDIDDTVIDYKFMLDALKNCKGPVTLSVVKERYKNIEVSCGKFSALLGPMHVPLKPIYKHVDSTQDDKDDQVILPSVGDVVNFLVSGILTKYVDFE